MPKTRERDEARRMLIEWATRYMASGDLLEASLALPLPDGRQLEIGLRVDELSRNPSGISHPAGSPRF